MYTVVSEVTFHYKANVRLTFLTPLKNYLERKAQKLNRNKHFKCRLFALQSRVCGLIVILILLSVFNRNFSPS